jgi:hypothetical protein
MPARNHMVTPLGAVTAGLLAGALGTVCFDTVQYLLQRPAGGQESFWRWEFAPVDNWDQAPDPGQVAKRLIEGFNQRKLPDRWAWRISTAMHWGYGSGSAVAYGIVAGSLRRPRPIYGLPFGSLVWAGSYVVLPAGGIYKPIWKYDVETLAKDLAAHLAYGAGSGVTFWVLTKILLRRLTGNARRLRTRSPRGQVAIELPPP